MSLGVGVLGVAAAWRMRARVSTLADALQTANEREVAFVKRTRRFADAARESVAAVRDELDAALRAHDSRLDVTLVFEEIDAQLTCVAAYGDRVNFYLGMHLAVDDDGSLLVCALRAGHRVTAHDAPAARLLHPADRFAAAVPLLLDAGRRCVVYVASVQKLSAAMSDQVVQLVDAAAPAYAGAVERTADRARAEYDGLTGLLSARAFRARLTAMVERARFAPLGRIGLLFIDTDHFKTWNDTYGHASGDALLREIAHVLQNAAPGTGDIVARNGGDEFCVILADAQKSTAIACAQRVCADIADANFALLAPGGGEGKGVDISASIGVACFPGDAAAAESLLEKADEAMYHAKRTGRDGVAYFGAGGELVRAVTAEAHRAPVDRRRGESDRPLKGTS